MALPFRIHFDAEILCLLVSVLFFFQSTLLFSLIRYTPLKFNNTYEYPWWGYALGGFFTLSSTIMAPLWMLYAMRVTPGTLKQVQSQAASVIKRQMSKKCIPF